MQRREMFVTIKNFKKYFDQKGKQAWKIKLTGKSKGELQQQKVTTCFKVVDFFLETQKNNINYCSFCLRREKLCFTAKCKGIKVSAYKTYLIRVCTL